MAEHLTRPTRRTITGGVASLREGARHETPQRPRVASRVGRTGTTRASGIVPYGSGDDGASEAGKMAAISVAGLVKRFGATRALDELDLMVESGQVHGFLGPNGAGKTTTLRVLLGLLRKNAGTASMLGLDPWRDAATLHRRLAFVPGDVSLWPNLTGGEVIDLLGALRGGLDPSRRADLIERFQLDPTKKCRAYSKGNRQKVALVAAFASDVELYLLDEPTSGLDPLMMAVFQDVVREAPRRRPHPPAVEPHPLRGRGAVRPPHDHPRRPHRRHRQLRGAAPPQAHDRRRRDGSAARRAGRGCPGSTTRASPARGPSSRSTTTT